MMIVFEVKWAEIEFKSYTINYMIFREDSWKGIVYSCIRSRCSNGTSAIYCAIGFVMSDNFTLGTNLDTKRIDIPYARHYNTNNGLYIFYPHFHCGLYFRTISISNNLCTKQGNSSIFAPRICGL